MSAQDAVTRSRGKPSECDIVVVILWSRLGSPSPAAMYARPGGDGYYTGTEWEYEDAWQAAREQGRPRLLRYRRTEIPTFKLDPANEAAVLEQFDQFKKVNAFCEACQARDGSIANPYDKPSDFAPLLKEHLRELIHQLTGLPLRSAPPPAGPDLPLAKAHYLSYLQDRHQYLSLKGMGLSERVPLQLPLLDLYVPLQAILSVF